MKGCWILRIVLVQVGSRCWKGIVDWSVQEGVKQVLEESGKSGMSAGWVVARCRSSLGKESAVGWF